MMIPNFDFEKTFLYWGGLFIALPFFFLKNKKATILGAFFYTDFFFLLY